MGRITKIVVIVFAILMVSCVQKYGFRTEKATLLVNTAEKAKIYYVADYWKTKGFGENMYSPVPINDVSFRKLIANSGIGRTGTIPRKVPLKKIAIIFQCGEYYYREYLDINNDGNLKYTIDCNSIVSKNVG